MRFRIMAGRAGQLRERVPAEWYSGHPAGETEYPGQWITADGH